jgi:small subunit ribosomal protein S20
MPIKHSAKKALRQNKKRRLRNIIYKTKIKNLTKKALLLYKENKKQDLLKIIPSLYRAFDIGAKVGVLKKNTAARRKSVIAKKLNSLK